MRKKYFIICFRIKHNQNFFKSSFKKKATQLIKKNLYGLPLYQLKCFLRSLTLVDRLSTVSQPYYYSSTGMPERSKVESKEAKSLIFIMKIIFEERTIRFGKILRSTVNDFHSQFLLNDGATQNPQHVRQCGIMLRQLKKAILTYYT